jgi:hypothetical protein
MPQYVVHAVMHFECIDEYSAFELGAKWPGKHLAMVDFGSAAESWWAVVDGPTPQTEADHKALQGAFFKFMKENPSLAHH